MPSKKLQAQDTLPVKQLRETGSERRLAMRGSQGSAPLGEDGRSPRLFPLMDTAFGCQMPIVF